VRRMKGNEKPPYKQRYLEEELSDLRVLGSGDFVQSVLRRNQTEIKIPRFKWKELVDAVAKWARITLSIYVLGANVLRLPKHGVSFHL
jgi:hypothetical protein